MSFMSKMLVNTAKGFVVSTATAVAVKSISNILGLSDSKVGKILSVGIPMMTIFAAEDPKITDLLFKESKKKNRKKYTKESQNSYSNIFGKDNTKKMNKAIANETGATEDEVNGVMSLFTPFFVDTIAEEEPEDAGMLGKMLGKGKEEVEKESPSLFKMTMKAIF